MPDTPLTTVFVTVGSTQFDQLIDCLLRTETHQILKQLGCRKLSIQYGAYKNASNLNLLRTCTPFEVELFDYKSSIEENIDNADLVVGHAGAGTVLEVLRKAKPLLIVINDTLMDNHQEELALELAENNFVMCSNTTNLVNSLKSIDVNAIQPFPRRDIHRFSSFIQGIYPVR